MKVLVIGGKGFIGAAVVRELSADNEVYLTCLEANVGEQEYQVDLSNFESIKQVLIDVCPDVIINCAGIVTNDDNAKLNLVFTENILRAVKEIKLNVKSVVVMGSAGEYGHIDKDKLPVNEEAPLNGNTLYALSKIGETNFARTFANENNIPLVVARIFNPIGSNMPPRQLIPGLQRQIQEIKNGIRSGIEVGRLDSERDYIDVRDVAMAIRALITKPPTYDVYNIGTGVATSTHVLINLALAESELERTIPVAETQPISERGVASRADIGRISSEYSWKPEYSPEDVMKEIFHGAS